MTLNVKRVYEPSAKSDGVRVLVDRLWPRGVSKADAKIDVWAKELAPSTELRKWYQHDPEKWDEFRTRYFAELGTKAADLEELRRQIGNGPATLVFGSKETELNNAAALREYLEQSRP